MLINDGYWVREQASSSPPSEGKDDRSYIYGGRGEVAAFVRRPLESAVRKLRGGNGRINQDLLCAAIICVNCSYR